MFIAVLIALCVCLLSLKGWHDEMKKTTNGQNLPLIQLFKSTPRGKKNAVLIMAFLALLSIVSLALMGLGY